MTLDAGEGQKIPKLEEVFELFQGNVFVNIEMKGPRSAHHKNRYDCALLADLVYKLVNKYNMHEKFLVSSFSSDILTEVERVRSR
jgi:glycerophosphoryl diester phosphodiesterase